MSDEDSKENSDTSSGATMACPFCSEEVKAIAKKCKHCGEILDPTMRATEEAKRMANRGFSPNRAPSTPPSQMPTQESPHNLKSFLIALPALIITFPCVDTAVEIPVGLLGLAAGICALVFAIKAIKMEVPAGVKKKCGFAIAAIVLAVFLIFGGLDSFVMLVDEDYRNETQQMYDEMDEELDAIFDDW